MAAKTNRPRRQRKGDRLLNPDATRLEIECDYGIAPLDKLAEEMDRKWGIDRLPELVTPQLAAKYGKAIAMLNEAIREQNPERCAQKAADCMRGLKAMDAEAESLGAPKASPSVIQHEVNGFRFGIRLDDRNWKSEPKYDFPVFTLNEIGNRLKEAGGDHSMIAEVKKHFPAAEVIDWNKELEDELPW